jgi:hypothetical protein
MSAEIVSIFALRIRSIDRELRGWRLKLEEAQYAADGPSLAEAEQRIDTLGRAKADVVRRRIEAAARGGQP